MKIPYNSLMRLALLGDIHTFRRFAAPWRMVNKRIVGMFSLWLNRQFRFRRELLPEVLRNIAAGRPDLLLLTGDVTTTSLPGEFADIRAALEAHVPGIPCVAAPGNHDRYIRAAMVGRTMERELGDILPAEFPDFRPLGQGWHLLRLDPAQPRFFSARGSLGQTQRARLRERLAGLTAQDGVVLMCHYPVWFPPGQPDRPSHHLSDAPALRALLEACPARFVYVHGHVHRPWCLQPAGLERILCVNAGAPTRVGREYPLGQGWAEVILPEAGDAPVRVLRHVPMRDAAGQWSWGVRVEC